MENMKIEILNSINIPYTKSAFSNNVGCKRSELDFIDILTMRLANDFIIDNEGCLVGNKKEKYCGRWFLDGRIVCVGRYFKANIEKLTDKLVVGFLVLDEYKNENVKDKLPISFTKDIVQFVANKKECCEQFVRNDGGTWVYIILDDIYKLSISKAYKVISTIIWKVIKRSYKKDTN